MKNIRRTLALLAGACLAGIAHAANPVDVEVFRAPQPKKIFPVSYPDSEQGRGGEGWVELNFMVDPAGKPYEVSVIESTGNAAFDNAAIKVVEKSVFDPARIGDRTVDSGMNLKVIFTMQSPATAARREFIATYKLLSKALDAGDRARADDLLANLAVRNLYEDRYRQLALATYAQKWGTEQEQRNALKHALAGEKRPLYLEKNVYVQVLNNLLQLQLKTLDLGGALKTWEQLRDSGGKESIVRWQGTMAKVQALRSEPNEVRVPGRIEHSSWFLELFKNHFSLDLRSGQVSDIKLRCQKQYLLFRYEPGVQYEVKGKNDECTLELVGEPGTTFELVQS
jgi:TonB family protein